MMRDPVRRSTFRIYAAPLAMAVLTACGLVTALLGDDGWDQASWIALAIPVASMILLALRP